MKIEVQLSKEQIQALSLKGFGISGRDRAKGEAIEEICRQVLLLQGATEVYSYEELDKQVNIGDLKVIKDNKIIHIECKSSHSYNWVNKLAMDLYYFDKYNNDIEYIQTTTGTNLGWIFYSQSDWIMCYNSDSSRLHIIKNYQEVKKNILEKVDTYLNKLPNTVIKSKYSNWIYRNNKNIIDGGLEGSVKEDTNKIALIVNLMLSKRTIERLGGQLLSIDIKLIEDNKKALNATNI